MRREGIAALTAALAVAGLAAGIAVAGSGASPEDPHAMAHSMATTHVIVTATDSKFTLSRRSAPTGTVVFTVTNKGKISHDFKIARAKTPLVSPGHSATLRVTFSKTGRYPYLSTVSGQASHGMKGVFSVVAAVAPNPPTTTTTTTGTVGTARTTVNVEMVEQPTMAFKLSQPTVPSGIVTFAITSSCDAGCSFDLEGIKAGAVMYTGQSETWTVPLPPGTYRYHCDVLPVMKGSLTVTP